VRGGGVGGVVGVLVWGGGGGGGGGGGVAPQRQNRPVRIVSLFVYNINLNVYDLFLLITHAATRGKWEDGRVRRRQGVSQGGRYRG